MSNATVVSFEDALRARADAEPVVLDPARLKSHQQKVDFSTCHAAINRVTVIKKLKTREITVFHDFSVAIPKGRKIIILGHRDSGKDTILNLIQRKLLPNRGKVWVNSRISWPIPMARFFDMKSTVRENALFFARIIGMNPKQLIDTLLDFCEIDPKILKEPLKNMPEWARKRFGLLLLLYCDFDLHLVKQQFRPEALKLDGPNAEKVNELVYGGDYLATADQVKSIPSNANLACVLYEGLLYQFEDVSEAVEVFEALPKPKEGPARAKDEDDEDFDDDEYAGETVF